MLLAILTLVFLNALCIPIAIDEWSTNEQPSIVPATVPSMFHVEHSSEPTSVVTTHKRTRLQATFYSPKHGQEQAYRSPSGRIVKVYTLCEMERN